MFGANGKAAAISDYWYDRPEHERHRSPLNAQNFSACAIDSDQFLFGNKLYICLK
jgi:hypothetical protein